MNGRLERERKFAGSRGFALARLEPRIGSYSVAPVVFERLHTFYYDTDDLRLAHWGCSLRFRGGEGWTFKIPVPHATPGLVREEHVFAGDRARIPTAVLELGTAYFRGAAPMPVAELRTLRTRRQLRSDDGSDAANVVEDDVRVVEGTRVVKRFREIEVELTDAASDEVLEDVSRLLRRRGAGKPDPMPKNVRAAGRRSRGPEIHVPPLDGRSCIGDVVRAALAAPVEQFVRHDARLRARPDEDAVHRARVAVRRLRSHLRAFLPLFDRGRACALRERLSWLQDGLSDARDADVLLADVRRLGESLPDADRRTIDTLLVPFHDTRRRAYERIGAMLREERYVALLCELVDTAKHPPLRAPGGNAACEAIPELLAEAWATLRKRVRRRSEPPADRELHAIRIAAKRVRYLTEAIAPVAGPRARRLASSVERLQSILGEQHDAVVACDRLRALASDEQRAFVAGELSGGAHAASLNARSAWIAAWRKAKRRRRQLNADDKSC